jgi:hypothetical protein
MKKILVHLTFLILILCSAVFTGCVSPVLFGTVKAPVVPPSAGIFTAISSPYTGDHDKPMGSKCGESSCKSILFNLFAFGDCSVDAAARERNLKEVDYIGYSFTNIFWMYMSWETKACGE